jgi:hypothetical protein
MWEAGKKQAGAKGFSTLLVGGVLRQNFVKYLVYDRSNHIKRSFYGHKNSRA